jgi:hypothetical protein
MGGYIKVGVKEIGLEQVGLEFVPWWEQVGGCCEHGNELSGVIKMCEIS